MPLISFCLSTYKRGSILKATLESIQRQDFYDYEVIVSDNDSDESAKDTVTGMNDPRFKYFSNGENLGMIKSFNKSLERSSGEYIVMMADDDPIYYDMLSTLKGLLHAYPGYGMYTGGCDWFCTDSGMGKLYKLNVGFNSCLSNEHNLNYVQAFNADEFVKNFFGFKNIIRHYLWSTCMVRKDILLEKGGIPDYGTPFLGDYAYMVVAASHSGCVVINKSLGCQTIHAQNFGRNQNDQLITLINKFPSYVTEKLQHLSSWPDTEKQMLNYVGLWVVSHLSFLNSYFTRSGKDKPDEFKNIETGVFNIGFMKNYKLRYLTKTRVPFLYNQLSVLKKKLT